MHQMDTSARSGISESTVERTHRRMSSLKENLALEEAGRPNAWAALVPRNQGVSANEMFHRRRLRRRGLLERLRVQCAGRIAVEPAFA